MTCVLTLVHGTWPDPHGWISARSFLRRGLASRLGDVTFREFTWSGANRHVARREGGVNLARFIREGREEHPDARHFVIAHSHGGNVALYAMRDPAAHTALDGIVTISTPFISAQRRDLRPHADVLAWAILGITALAALVAIDAMNGRYLVSVWMLASAVAMVHTRPALMNWLIAAGQRGQTRIVRAYQPPPVERSRLLVVLPRGDEAGRWLRAWEVVATAPFLIGCLLLAAAEVALRSNFAVVLDRLAKSTLQRGLNEIYFLGLDGLALAIAGLALCLIWGVVLPIVSSVMRWPGYWREPLLANVLVRIGSDPVPPAPNEGSHAAHVFLVPRESLMSRVIYSRLRHSAICESSAVVDAIAEWIGADDGRSELTDASRSKLPDACGSKLTDASRSNELRAWVRGR